MNDLSLSVVFDSKRVSKVFTTYVWDAIRSQTCQDLSGFYDYRFTLDQRVEGLCSKIVNGSYRPRAGLSVQIARSDLLARHMHIAHPDDALVLQAISEALLPFVKTKQPSENAFYSRSHGRHVGIHTINQGDPYPWYKLWPIYQERILKFELTKPILVITDIQAFFDSVRFSVIRRHIAHEYVGSQALVDLMLAVFENFLPRSMYAPVTLQGIPTIDLDAPRLVAHMLLFSVDKYLKDESAGCFARWMDDINFAVDTVQDARRIVREVDRILRLYGLRLGGGKTKVLPFADAREYLQQAENQYLNILETRAKRGMPSSNRELAALIRRFIRFRRKRQYGHWDKVMRRYYRVISSCMDRCKKMTSPTRALIRHCEEKSIEDFEGNTSTQFRQAVLRFWGHLLPNKKRISRIAIAILDLASLDDETTFTASQVLVGYSLAPRFRPDLVTTLKAAWGKRMLPGVFFASAWLVACYGTTADVAYFISRTEGAWEGNYFYARQVVALWSLLPYGSSKYEAIKKKFGDLHDADVSAQIEYVEGLRSLSVVPRGLRGYLPTNKNLKHMDLRRGILVRNILMSPNLTGKTRKDLLEATRIKTRSAAVRRIALELSTLG